MVCFLDYDCITKAKDAKTGVEIVKKVEYKNTAIEKAYIRNEAVILHFLKQSDPTISIPKIFYPFHWKQQITQYPRDLRTFEL